jgi:hypothetical protein
VDAALGEMQARFKDGLEKLVSGNGLTLMFKMRDAFLDAWSFFDNVQDKGLVNVPALRARLTARCDAPLRGLAETLDASLPWDAEVIAALPAWLATCLADGLTMANRNTRRPPWSTSPPASGTTSGRSTRSSGR